MFCEGDTSIAIHTNGSGEISGWGLVGVGKTCDETFEEHPDVAGILSIHPDSSNSFHFGMLYRRTWETQQKSKLPTARDLEVANEIYQKCMTVGKVQAVAQLIHDYVMEVQESDT